MTGFLKQGKASCGVARRYTGSVGTITGCRIGVFAAYVSGHGPASVDRQLYPPKDWAADRGRRAAARVPEEVAFAAKPAIAAQMIARAIAAGVPFSWVAGGSIYGVGEIGRLLRRAGKGYALAVTGKHQFWSWDKPRVVAGTAADIAGALPASDWQRLSAGSGPEGERLHEWAYLELADLTHGRRVRLRQSGCLDARAPHPPQHRRSEPRLLHDLVPHRHADRDARGGRGRALGGRGRLRGREGRARARPRRDAKPAQPAPAHLARRARLRHARGGPAPRQRSAAPEKRGGREGAALVRRSVQEIRRVAMRLAQRRSEPAYIIAWSAWRRAHQAAAQAAHIRRRAQL